MGLWMVYDTIGGWFPDTCARIAGLGVSLGVSLFHEPLSLDDYWLILLLPLVLGISVVYKTIKLDDLSGLVHQAASLALQIVAFMILAASLLWLITELV